jgi:uncharacterized protein (TIGR02001 family)
MMIGNGREDVNGLPASGQTRAKMRRRRSGYALWLVVWLPTAGAWSAEFQGSIGASTNNVFRGLTQSQNEGSVEADAYLSATHWFGGVTGESVKRVRTEPTSAELIGYVGYRQLLSENWNATASLRHYDYVSTTHRSRYDYDELDAAVSWRQQLVVALIVSPDTYSAAAYHHFGRGAAFALELTGREPLPYGLSLDAGIGYYDLRQEVDSGYAYWSAGVAKQWRRWEAALRYTGTDAEARHLYGRLAGDRVVASITWFF